ncbi:MAG: ParA family protein [Thermodesulfobacteriota bacterium]
MGGKIICCANNKGGIGKTSATCHLAVALARRGHRVLVIDNDPQCNATGILGKKGILFGGTMYEIYEKSVDRMGVSSCIYETEYEGCFLLPNAEETSGLEMSLAAAYPESLTTLRDRVSRHARVNYDFTFIDCPPAVGLFVANALFASDFAVVPVDAGSAHSLDGLKKLLDLIGSVQEAGNPGLRFLKLLVNRVDLRTAISRVILEDVRNTFSDGRVFATSIPQDTVFERAEYAKETVFKNHPRSRGARTYENLAEEFLAAV